MYSATLMCRCAGHSTTTSSPLRLKLHCSLSSSGVARGPQRAKVPAEGFKLQFKSPVAYKSEESCQPRLLCLSPRRCQLSMQPEGQPKRSFGTETHIHVYIEAI